MKEGNKDEVKENEKKFLKTYTAMEGGWAAIAFDNNHMIYDDLNFMDVRNNFKSVADIGLMYSLISPNESREPSSTQHVTTQNTSKNTSTNPNSNL